MTCAECGNATRASTGPGRLLQYRRDTYELPSDMAFEACNGCGAEWFTASQIDALSAHLEVERVSRATLKSSCT